MPVRKIKAGGVNIAVQNFIGEDGILFYDSNTGDLRLSDGHTPGGLPLTTATNFASSSTVGQVRVDGTTITVDQYGVISAVATVAETDPVFNASAAAGISAPDISNWNTAYSWGNHADAGYLTTDATDLGNFVFTASQVSVSNDGDITLVTNANTWTFAADGFLTFPNGDLTIGNNGSTNAIVAATDTSFVVFGQGLGGFVGVEWVSDATTSTTNAAAVILNSPFSASSGTVQIVTGAVTGPTAENTWEFGTDGTLTAPGHLLPNTDLAYDLGSTTTQWRSIYVGTGTIYIGGVALGVNQDNYVTVDGNPIITVNTSGNLTVQGNTNLVLGSVAISDTAPDATTPGSQWFNTVEGRTYIASDGVWLDASPTQIPSPETYLGEIIIDGTTILLPPGGEILDSNGNVLLGGAVSTPLPSWITVVADTNHLPTLNTDYGWDNQGAWTVNATVQNNNEGTSYPFRTTFSIPNDTISVTTVDFVATDTDADFGIGVFESGTTPTWDWDPHPSRIGAQYNGTNPEIYGTDNSVSSGGNLPGPGTYTARLTVEPTAPGTADIVLETLNSNDIVIDTVTYTETSFFGTSYKIGFASDQDSGTPRVYFKNLTININNGETIYTNTLMNGNSVGESSSGGVTNGWQLTSSTAVVSLTSDGTLALPGGSSILDGMGAIRLEPSGASSSTQALLIYPTAVDGNHIHLTAGGGETDLYLGSDIQYVKVDHSGSIVIGAVGANTSTWTFGTDAVLTLPNGMTIDGYGTLGANATIDIGGDNTRIRIDNNGAPPGLYITTDAAGANYGWQFGPDGVLTLSTASTILGTGLDPNVYIETLTTSTTNTWTFSTDGNLDLPAGGDITQNGNSVLYPKVDTVSTTSMTFITTDQSIIFADPTAANGTVDLYLPDNPPEGKNYTVKNISAGTTLVGTSGPTIYLETEFGLYSSGTYATINVTNAAITWVFSNNGYRIINIFGLA